MATVLSSVATTGGVAWAGVVVSMVLTFLGLGLVYVTNGD
jgi:hypothetical protein